MLYVVPKSWWTRRGVRWRSPTAEPTDGYPRSRSQLHTQPVHLLRTTCIYVRKYLNGSWKVFKYRMLRLECLWQWFELVSWSHICTRSLEESTLVQTKNIIIRRYYALHDKLPASASSTHLVEVESFASIRAGLLLAGKWVRPLSLSSPHGSSPQWLQEKLFLGNRMDWPSA